MPHAVVRKLSPKTISRFKDTVLGRDFDLSVAYVARPTMRRINRERRGVDTATDVLSFELGKKSGELLFCLPEVASHARAWGTEPSRYLPYLVIHGLLHLKGHDHGRIMDKEEKKYCRALGASVPQTPTTNGTKNRSRH